MVESSSAVRSYALSEERFDRIETGLNKLTVLLEDTRDQVRLLAEGFASTNDRLASTNDRLDRFEQNVNVRFDSINGRLDRFEQNVNVRFDRIETVLTKHDARIATLETR
jgi:hypothetical protein